MKPKILVVLGPTASGKSALAVTLARKFNGLNRSKGSVGRTSKDVLGEIISADSRQVYRGLNIGTGKITKREMKGVPHHLLDVASPKRQFSVAEYKTLAEKAIDEILALGKLPIVCGGTGLYIKALVDGMVLPEVLPSAALRARLEKKSPAQLFKILQKLDPAFAKKIDRNNPRRLVRAIEIATTIGKVPKLNPSPKYDAIQIGIKLPDAELKKRIAIRLFARMSGGIIAEARKLHREGLSWKRMDSLGLEYRYLAQFCQGKISRPELIAKLQTEIWHYAKRQYTWFKRDKRIRWVSNQKDAGKIAILKR